MVMPSNNRGVRIGYLAGRFLGRAQIGDGQP
jgi:hypothetical protein